jgi:hypothetical protein
VEEVLADVLVALDDRIVGKFMDTVLHLQVRVVGRREEHLSALQSLVFQVDGLSAGQLVGRVVAVGIRQGLDLGVVVERYLSVEALNLLGSVEAL